MAGAITVVAIVVAVGGNGTGEPNVPVEAAETTATPTTAPDLAAPDLAAPAPTTTVPATVPSTTAPVTGPTLGELIPDLGTEVLRIAYVDPANQIQVVEWAAIASQPAPPRPNLGVGMWPERVGFEPGGARIAMSSRGSLFVDNFALDAGVLDWAWHPSSPEVAWITQPPGSSDAALYRQGTYTWDRSQIGEVARLPLRSPGANRFDGSWALPAWGDWGYAVTFTDYTYRSAFEDGDQPVEVTLILDPDGTVRFAVAGSVMAATEDGTLAVRATPDVFDLAVASGFDRDAVIGEASLLDVPAGWAVIDQDGTARPVKAEGRRPVAAGFTADETLVAVERQWDGNWAVVAITIAGSEQTMVIPQSYQPVWLSEDGGRAVFTTRGLIVLADWENNVIASAAFDLGTIVAVGL